MVSLSFFGGGGYVRVIGVLRDLWLPPFAWPLPAVAGGERSLTMRTVPWMWMGWEGCTKWMVAWGIGVCGEGTAGSVRAVRRLVLPCRQRALSALITRLVGIVPLPPLPCVFVGSGWLSGEGRGRRRLRGCV